MIPDINTFRSICDRAHEAGMKAVEGAKIVPMIVGAEAGFMSGRIDYTQPVEYVADGVCGFAWICVYPEYKGNTKLGKQERFVLEKFGFWKNDYEKCYQLSVRDFNQSLQKKEVYARACAEVFRAEGINAYARSRID
jgi:hypothetical protein